MAGVVFDNKVWTLPGVVTRTDTTGLIVSGLLGSGTVAMVGTALGGALNEVTLFTDTSSVTENFKGGDLVDHALIAFQEGASVIYMTRVGSATAAYSTLTDVSSANVATVTAVDLGSWTNNIKHKVETTMGGFKYTVQYLNSDTGKILSSTSDTLATVTDLVTWAASDTVASGLITVTSISSGGVPQAFGYTNLSGGDDGLSPSTPQWQAGLDLYAEEAINLIHVCSTDPVVHALLKTHVTTAAENLFERIGVVGGEIGLDVGDYQTADSILKAAYDLNTERMIYVSPGTDDKTPAYTAARVTGMLAGVDVATSLTHRVSSASAIERKFTMNDKVSMVNGGVLCIEEVPSGRRVVRGITTAQDLGPTTEHPFKEISILRIADYINQNMRAALEAQFVGKKGVDGVEKLIDQAVRGLLFSFREKELISAYGSVSVRKGTDPKVFYVDYTVQPVFAINFILITTHLVNSL